MSFFKNHQHRLKLHHHVASKRHSTDILALYLADYCANH